MSKFKIGQTVVVMSSRFPSMSGTKYIIRSIKEALNGGYIVSDTKTGLTGWHEDVLVSEEVYESTLNQAMIEEVA